MVSLKQLEGEYSFMKQNTSSEQSKYHQTTLRGIETLLYQFGTPAKVNGACGGFSCTVEEEQSLLDTLLLSQWEDRAWKGQLTYDVTTCEIKVIGGGKKFIAQLNEKWNSNFVKEFENLALQPLGPFKPSYMKTLKESILFCAASGEKESSELFPSSVLPKEGALVIFNENPVEYGHIFLVPYDIHQRRQLLDKRKLQLIAQIAVEVNSSSFRIFCDYNASTNSDQIYFQAGYFANPFPVELLPAISVSTDVDTEILICEVEDYPLKVLLFMSKSNNMFILVELVAEICSSLQQHQDTAFSLLISDCGTKMFLFPQVHTPETGNHLSTWECGGYFICGTRSEFDCACEVELSKRMASASLDDQGFQTLKQLCCSVALKLTR